MWHFDNVDFLAAESTLFLALGVPERRWTMMFPFRSIACAAVLAVLLCATATANQHAHAQVVEDIADGRLDQFSLLEAAGNIGGMDTAAIGDAQRRLNSVVALLDRNSHTSDIDRLTALLSLLHDHIFTGRYDSSASQISATFANGDYNCASAAVLFLAAAEMADFSACAVLLPGHVHCRVWIERQRRWLDVEPSVRSGQSDSNVATTTTQVRELTRVQLLAKLYYNLGIDQLRQGNYAGALRCARYGWQLDPRHRAAKDNVTAIVNNWSLALCQRQEFEEALRLIRNGLAQSPDDDLLAVNEIHIYITWMQELMRRGDVPGVEMRLHDALARYPQSTMLRTIDDRLRQATVVSGR
jgi:tetratricopeptide (TPR) repeat protein